MTFGEISYGISYRFAREHDVYYICISLRLGKSNPSVVTQICITVSTKHRATSFMTRWLWRTSFQIKSLISMTLEWSTASTSISSFRIELKCLHQLVGLWIVFRGRTCLPRVGRWFRGALQPCLSTSYYRIRRSSVALSSGQESLSSPHRAVLGTFFLFLPTEMKSQTTPSEQLKYSHKYQFGIQHSFLPIYYY